MEEDLGLDLVGGGIGEEIHSGDVAKNEWLGEEKRRETNHWGGGGGVLEWKK